MAEGDIGAVIDTLEFDTTFADFPCMCHVSGNIYAVVYKDNSGYGVVGSVDIDASGNIGAAFIDTLTFYTGVIVGSDIIHVSGNVYAVVFEGTGSDGYVLTFSIDASGNISATHIDFLLFNSIQCKGPKIVHVSGTVFAIVYSGQFDDGFITTVSISNAGNITDPAIETVEFMTTNCIDPDILHVSGNVFAIAYRGTDNDGFVSTIDISVAGDIAAVVTETLEFDTGGCYQPEIIHITDDVYAVAYQGPAPNGVITTFTISGTGDIGAAIIDTFNFATAGAYLVDIVLVSGGFVAICYQGPASDGFLCTFSINDDGTINDATLETYEFCTTGISYPAMVHVSGDIYAIAYQGVDSDGFLKSVNIETIVSAGIKHFLLMGIG